MIDFGVLGPVTVCRDGCPVALSGGVLRQLLAVLLCRAGQPVTVDQLIDALWTERGPATAGKSLQVYVHRLRRRLGDGRVRYGSAAYSIVVDRSELDAWRFVDLAARGRAARRAGRLDEAGQLLWQALAQWRAAAYADVAAAPIIAEETRRLNDLRLVTLEERIAVDLDRGRHCELVPELSGLARAHPYREALQGQLMLALYRAGRQVEALEVFRNTRALLVDELGIEPTAALQRLHQQILTADPAIDTPTPPDASAVTDSPFLVADPSPAAAFGVLLRCTRAAILRIIAAGHCTTTELAHRGGISAATASQHATALRQAGLITTTRIGTSVLHTVTPLGRKLLDGRISDLSGRTADPRDHTRHVNQQRPPFT